jgi:undecaprenyl-diphosphatase
LIAFVCTAGPAFVLKKVIGKNLENLPLIGGALVVGGVIMWAVDAAFGGRAALRGESPADELERMSLGQAVWIGCCQILSAVVPGTSRSMITIAAGQTSGLTRSAALEFSFLLSIPTMVAATGYDLLKFLKPAHGEPVPHIDGHGWVVLAIGFVISFVVAWAVVAWFMNWVRTRGFVPFAIYRLVAGAAVLVWALGLVR